MKKIINTFNSEFGYELISAVPFAYYLYLNNELEKTISGTYSEPLYYFSPNHEININNRSWDNTLKLMDSDIPNAKIHTSKLDLNRFIVPPYKEYYANNEYKWSKPTICICNRYNYEWGKPPINYFSLDILDKIFKLVNEKYQIVYIGVDILDEMQDSANSLYLGDAEFCKKYPDVIFFQDILKNSNFTWNELLLRIFANCENFITMNGGYSILASFFGGTNLIYSNWCSEILPEENAFNRWYPEFSNSRVVVSRTYDEIIDKSQIIFMENKPLINVIITTQQNKDGFKRCINSIKNQTYKNINIIVGLNADDSISDEYVIQENCRVIFSESYKYLINKIGHGLIICLDDSMYFDNLEYLENLINKSNIQTYKNEILPNILYRKQNIDEQIEEVKQWWSNKKFDIEHSEIINLFIKKYNYTRYLEIGVKTGECFKNIEIEHKDGVDPTKSIYTNYNITSDEFFENLNDNDKYDIIFIDGLHYEEQVYKDIKNSLKHLTENGVILCHDINPPFEICQRREHFCNVWNGDSWKAFVKIRSEQKDLDIYTIDTDFGIGVIKFGKSESIFFDKIIDYNYLENNRKHILNLISVDEFLKNKL
jgi:hypothetical protein